MHRHRLSFIPGMAGSWLFFLVLALPLSILAVPTPATAQDGMEGVNYQPYQLGEVVVTGEKEGKESPTTISEISAEEIENQNAQNLGDALRLLPGVYFRQGRAKQEFYATIRGFEQDKALILLDGMPIYQPYEGLVNLNDIPVQNIAKIKVIKGIPSSLYGANAMGGVINIITKKGTAEPYASLSYQVSDYNTHHLEATHGRKIGDVSYFIGVSHKESDGFRLADEYSLAPEIVAGMAVAPSNIPHTPVKADDGLRLNSDYERDAFTFTGTWDTCADNTLGLSLEYYNNEYGIPPGAIYRETKKSGGTAYWYPRYWRFDDWERYTLNLTDEYRLSDSITLKGRVFYDDYESALNAYDDDTYTTQFRTSGAPSFDSSYDDYNAGGNLYAFFNGLKNHDIRLGFGFKRDVHESEYVYYLSTPEEETLVSHTWTAAAEDAVRLSDRFLLTIGASYDVFEQKKRDQSSGSAKGDDIAAFSPQAGVDFAASEAVSLYASVGKKIRFPTMRNLYADGVIGPMGNPDLKEEKSIGYEFGGQWRICSDATLEGALFYNDVKDMIIFDNQIGRFEQYEDALIYGAELALSGQPAKNLTARIGYTFLIAENDGSLVTVETEYLANDLTYKPDEIPYRPRHKIDLDLTRTFDSGLAIHLNGSYISERTYYDHADPTDNTKFVAMKKTLDAYFLFNTKVTYDFNRHYQIFGAVDNLFDEEYEELYLFPAPGLRAWAGIKLTL